MSGQGPLTDEYGDSSDYQRPRRPSEDTLAYIKSLPLDIKQSREEVELFLSMSDEGNGDNYPQLFVAALSALDEVRTEIASLAGDEDGSQCLEILARVTAPYSELAVRKLLMGCAGYYLHLATHRYASHAVQTILQLATTFLKPGDLAELILEEDQYQEEHHRLPSLSELILGAAEELSPHATHLAVHVCGSHVLRTLLCVLAGIDLKAAPGSGDTLAENGNFRRGRAKKKKKKKPVPGQTLPPHAGVMHMVYLKHSLLRIDVDDDAYTEALDKLAEELAGGQCQRPGELQKLAIHVNAGPLLIVLLRVLTYVSCPDKSKWQQSGDIAEVASSRGKLGIHPLQPKFELESSAHRLAMKILCWPDAESPGDDSFVADIIYGLAGEPRGSHMLEALLEVSPGPFYDSLLQHGDFYNRATLQEYIDDSVSNFVVQTILSTVHTKEQAEVLLKALSAIVASGVVIDPDKKRRGILWKTVEVAAKHRVGQDGLLKSIRLGFASLQDSGSTEKEFDGTTKVEVGNTSTQKKKPRKKASTVNLADCIQKLLDAKIEGGNGRVVLDVSGARTVYFMLRFAPRLCEETITGIVSYPTEMLIKFAKDGLASRCIWDGILEGAMDSPCFSLGLQKLRDTLSGNWVTMSCDRVGQHIVRKIFRQSPSEERMKIAEELSRAIPRLSGSSMGRSIMEVCAIRHFSAGAEAWNRAVKKAGMESDWLNDVVGSDDQANKNDSKAIRKREKLKDNRGGFKKAKTSRNQCLYYPAG